MAERPPTLAESETPNPRIGMPATVRNRRGIISWVEPYDSLVRAARWSAMTPFVVPDGCRLDRQTARAAPLFGAIQVEDFQLVPEWRPVAQSLRAAGIPAPTDVDFDLVVEGRVSGEKAPMVWRTPAGDLFPVRGDGEPCARKGRVLARADSDPAAVVSLIRTQLETVA